MKITQVISDTNIGGAGVLLSSVVCGLKDDFEFEVILPKGSLLRDRFPHGVRVTELQTSADTSFHSADVKIFADYFKSTRPRVIHTHASLSARLAAKLACGSICCSTRHCATPEPSLRRLSLPERCLYNFCTDITVSTADFATRNLIRQGISENRIITIKNGSPDLTLKADDGASPHARLSVPDDAIIIGSVARLERVKGQDLIIRSAPAVISRFPNAYFVFIGEGSMKDEYKRLAAALGIEKHVRFTGFVQKPADYQRAFTLNVNASRGTETSCLATSECLSLGVPTVASDFGGNPEMIKDGENGFVFSSDNPHALSETVIRILSDRFLYGKLREGARKSYVDSFCADRMTAKYRNLYTALHKFGSGRGAELCAAVCANVDKA